jgi:hypothetical protein
LAAAAVGLLLGCHKAPSRCTRIVPSGPAAAAAAVVGLDYHTTPLCAHVLYQSGPHRYGCMITKQLRCVAGGVMTIASGGFRPSGGGGGCAKEGDADGTDETHHGGRALQPNCLLIANLPCFTQSNCLLIANLPCLTQPDCLLIGNLPCLTRRPFSSWHLSRVVPETSAVIRLELTVRFGIESKRFDRSERSNPSQIKWSTRYTLGAVHPLDQSHHRHSL